MTRNGASITLSDIYQVCNRLEDKMEKRFGELEDRIAAQESFRNKAIGIIGVVGTFSSVVTTWIWNRIIERQ